MTQADWFAREQLHRAARDGDLNEIRRLLDAGFSPWLFDDLSRTPLHYAVEGEHYRAVELLLQAGTPVNAHEEDRIGETPLSLAVQADYVEMVELLLRHGADPDIPGWMGLTARLRACKRKDAASRQIAALLERHARASMK
ncbi:ankyrin repeat domain-containing protein [Janthinobacterium tructae]|uniref:ankyrin repeat domain-containing protein n=1 Tax=Janthinobacterium tructae TaxID=2590869 RepID=UPI00249AE5A4|nr:ankyrin repeat domain-containing protein [Janthinobacterium tructae]MDI3294556.1 ankyrin repeat domain-containing protein [Janthinobacterium tructae]